MKIQVIHKVTLEKLYTFVLIVFPLISSYDLFRVSPLLLFCVCEFIICLFWILKGHSIKNDRRIWIYLGYMIISATMGMINSNQGTVHTISIRLFLYIISFFVFGVFPFP